MFGSALFVALVLSQATEAQAPAPQSGQGNERICRGGGQRSLGSHIRTTRRCKTAAQWQAEDEARTRTPQSMRITEGQNDGRNASLQPR